MLSAEQTRDGQHVSKPETDSEVWGTCVTYTSIAVLAVLTSVVTAYVLPPADRSTLLPYWRTAVIYHIYPRSFQDSNNDGIGDLPGIISRLDYISSLGVDVVWLGPVYESPMFDFGYDVSNFTAVDSVFGTIDDMKQLVNKLHEKGMKLIIDFIPNHSSDEHPWFTASQHRDQYYNNFYIWNDGVIDENGTVQPPNNWRSAFGGSAWQWDDTRKQFYFHQFDRHQPDLNYRHTPVIEAMNDVLSFWVEKVGVDGFRIDSLEFLLEAADLHKDEPVSNQCQSAFTNHMFTRRHQDTHDVLTRWRQLFVNKTNHVFLLGESKDPTVEMEWWKELYHRADIDMPINFYLMKGSLPGKCPQSTLATCLKKSIDRVMKSIPGNAPVNWVMGSHDVSRIASRFGVENVNAINTLVLLLPGASITYQGDELGMEDIALSYEDTKDVLGQRAGPVEYMKKSRDGCRSPMQWTSDANAGFTAADIEPWLPINKNYVTNNVQRLSSDQLSTLSYFKQLVWLRKRPAFLFGALEWSTCSDDVISFKRQARGRRYAWYLIAVNVGQRTAAVDFSGPGMPANGKVTLAANQESFFSNNKVSADNNNISLKHVTLAVGDSVVIEFYSSLL